MSDTVEHAYPEAPIDTVKAQRAFNWSIVVSGIRCTLGYVVLPFIAPFIGLAPGVGPVIGLAIGAVAIGANVWSLRRFWAHRHRLRRPITVLHVSVIILLLVLMATDVRELLAA
ncbi:MAG: hypothetical protein HKN46_07680 [Acidimicrobiia bacterium]|nr:hypothetical protein [Acidimicrobiia bacterium]